LLRGAGSCTGPSRLRRLPRWGSSPSGTVENVLALVRGAVIHLLCDPHPLVIGPALLHLLRALPEPPYQLEGCARPRDTPLVGAPSSSSLRSPVPPCCHHCAGYGKGLASCLSQMRCVTGFSRVAPGENFDDIICPVSSSRLRAVIGGVDEIVIARQVEANRHIIVEFCCVIC
jgi:hypothetical protein